MVILEHSHVWDWCRERGVALGADGAPDAGLPRRYDPAFAHRARTYYASGERSGREPEVASAAAEALGPWDECLLWVTGWGAWPSSEDWPRFYAGRGAAGERRSLDVAPGHLFAPGEAAALCALLTQVLEYAWDAVVLPAAAGRATDRRLVVSHDEWVELQRAESAGAITPAV